MILYYIFDTVKAEESAQGQNQVSSDSPANEDDLDFQINGPTTLDLESFITNYEGDAYCLPNNYFIKCFFN